MPPPRPSRAIIWILLLGFLAGFVVWAGLGSTDDSTVVSDTESAGGGGVESLLGGEGPDTGSADDSNVRAPHAVRDLSVRVVHAVTCKPISGVQVFAMSGFAKVLGSRFSDQRGVARGFADWQRLYAVVAWHPDFQLVGHVVGGSTVELSMVPMRNMRISIEPRHAVAEEWLTTCDQTVLFKYKIQGNPVKRHPDYFEYRIFLHLGLDRQRWPLSRSVAIIPRYLDAEGTAQFLANQKLPSRTLRPTPVRRGRHMHAKDSDVTRRARSKTVVTIAKVEDEATIVPQPKSEHALILRYARRPDDVGLLWVLLSGSTKLPAFRYSTFESRRGVATFKIFDLDKREYTPTLVTMVNGKRTQSMECRPVSVDGRTDVQLVPRMPARLTVRVVGADGPGEVKLISRHAAATTPRPQVDAANHTRTWSRLTPGTYEVFARFKGRTSSRVSVRLADAAAKQVELQLRPTCALTLVVWRSKIWEKVTMREVATGHERELLWENVSRDFDVDNSDRKYYVLTGKDHLLDVPQGIYTFSAGSGATSFRKTIALDQAKQRVELY